MNLAQLHYFCKLAELQHYTKAAKELYITQPTLSNSIARLEDELGAPLFERSGRNVRLTKHGVAFQHYAQEALKNIELGTQVVGDQAGQLGGTINVGTIYTIQDGYLPALMRSYRNKFGTGPTINVFQGLTNPLIEDLENDRYDVAFAAHVPNKDELTFVPILYQKLVLIVHADSEFAGRDNVSLDELHGQHIISYRTGTPLGDEVDALMQDHHLQPAERYDDEITLSSMVDASDSAVGISLDTLGVAPFSNLVKVNLQDVPEGFHPVFMVFKRNGYKAPAVQHFIEMAKTFQWSQDK